jgi:hypothetical protein
LQTCSVFPKTIRATWAWEKLEGIVVYYRVFYKKYVSVRLYTSFIVNWSFKKYLPTKVLCIAAFVYSARSTQHV